MNSYRQWRTYCRASALLLLLVTSQALIAKAEGLPKGTVIERVTCEADVTQSYALYLPSTYTPQKQWPVIYAFDPVARGSLPVRLFKDAAEQYGYIVAGSYNSQNGIKNDQLKIAISSMINDTRKRFSIDERRIYTTGFSGGARVAARIASSCAGCIAGVIACGAGFPTDITPASTTSFVFYGTVGLSDFNYPELKRLDEKLGALGIPHHLAIFDGTHQWAPAQLLAEAVEWMEINAIREGSRVRDEALIEAIWKKRLERVRAVESMSDAYQTYLVYVAMTDDFKELRDVSVFEKKAPALKDTREVKHAMKEERDELDDQAEIARRLIDLGSQLFSEPFQRSRAMKELKTLVEGLRKKGQAAENSSEGRAATRALFQVSAQTFEAALYNYIPNRQYGTAIANLEVAEATTPDFPQVSYELARVYALNGDKKRSLEALHRAVTKGWTDVTGIESQKDFDSIRTNEEFESIVKNLKQARPSK